MINPQVLTIARAFTGSSSTEGPALNHGGSPQPADVAGSKGTAP
jgi:hypothetical protein